MKRIISLVLTLVMVLGMAPAVAWFAASADESATYTIMQDIPASIIPSDTGTKGAWYNNGSTYVTTPGSANYIEIAQDGYLDGGALHVYQDNVATNDMSLGLFLGGQPAGTYTVKLYVKGDLGLLDQTCKFYPYGCIYDVPNLHSYLGTTDVADWTEISYQVNVSAEFYYLIFSFSKYNWQTNMYIDNIQLINASGVNVLGDAGNFCTSQEVTVNADDMGQWPDYSLLDASKEAVDGTYIAGLWTPFRPTSSSSDYPAWVTPEENSETYRYAEIVANGYKDAGSLHLSRQSGAYEHLGVAIKADMVAGQTYTLKMALKTTITAPWGGLVIYGNGDPMVTQLGDGTAVSNDGKWHEVSVSFTANRNGVAFKLDGGSYSGDLYMDNIRLLDGNGNDLLAGYGDFYTAQKPAVPAVPEIIPIADSNNGENYVWYNQNGFVNNETKVLEVVEDGADDIGSIHVYQPDGQTADMDMLIAIRADKIPAGTYTLQYKIKGSDLGNTDNNSNKFYFNGYSGLTNQFRVAAGQKTLADWTVVEETVTIDADVYYIMMMVSKYVNGADYYVDNVKVLDAEGNDMLGGAGNFCTAVEEEEEAPIIKPSYISAVPISETYQWYNGNSFWPDVTYDVYIVDEGADDVGAMYIYQKDGVVAAEDMRVHLRTDGIPAGTYTLQYNIKGSDLGITSVNDACRFYLDKDPSATSQFRVLAGSKTVSEWTTLSETVVTTADSDYFILGISKYVCGIDCYVDNVKLLDANGNDMLKGAGNFCYVWTECTHVGTYIETITYPATCLNDGSIVELCTECGLVINEQIIPALEHSYNAVVTAPTAIKDGYTTYTCSACGHSYVDNIVPAIGIGELKFCGGSIVLEDDLTVRYLVNKNLFIEDAYTNPYVVFSIGNKTQIVTNYQVLDNYYAFDCTDIAPSQLGDVVTGTMYAYLNNMEYSVAATYSVAEYCYNILAETNDAKLKTLIVDLLNYGSASQQYVWYKDKTPSNTNLTDEQKAYASTDSELVSALKTDYAVVDNASAKWTGATLVLQNNVCIRFRFAADNLDGLSVKIVAAGQEWTVTKFEPTGVEGQYYAFFDGLKAHQMSEDVFATVYADGVAVSNTVRYSIESYAYAMQNDANVRLANLVKAMMRYGKSAAAYLN